MLTVVAPEMSVCHGCGAHIRDTQVRVFCDSCLGDGELDVGYTDRG